MADEEKPVAPAKPDFHLVVIHAFGDYQKGDKITDAAEIKAVSGGENHRAVARIFP